MFLKVLRKRELLYLFLFASCFDLSSKLVSISKKPKTVKVISSNPILGACHSVSIAELEKISGVESNDAIDTAQDLCNKLEGQDDYLDESGRPWMLVDSIVLRLGVDAYTWKDVTEFAAIQNYLKKDALGFDPGFAATAALNAEASLLGISTANSSAGADLLREMQAKLRLSDPAEFSKRIMECYGFSAKSFKVYSFQRELALTMISRLNPSKRPTMNSFVDYLQKKGIDVSLRYDVDIAILDQAQMESFNENKSEKLLAWVPFRFVQEADLNPEVTKVLKNLLDGEISAPISLGNEYWLVKKNKTDVGFLEELVDGVSLWDNMVEESMKEMVTDLKNKISSKPAKTVILNN